MLAIYQDRTEQNVESAMEYDIKVDNDSARFVVRIRGSVDVKGTRILFNELVSHAAWDNCYDLILDCSHGQLESLTLADIQNLADLLQEFIADSVDIRLAIVLTTDLNFGLGRMWQAYSSYYLKCDICIFRTLHEVENWLDARDITNV